MKELFVYFILNSILIFTSLPLALITSGVPHRPDLNRLAFWLWKLQSKPCFLTVFWQAYNSIDDIKQNVALYFQHISPQTS